MSDEAAEEAQGSQPPEGLSAGPSSPDDVGAGLSPLDDDPTGRSPLDDGPTGLSPLDDDPLAELRAASPRQPLGAWWVGAAGLAVAGVLLVTENLRAYGYAMGVTMGVLAVLRAVLPESRAGGLAVRGRWLDATAMALLGAAVAVLASTLRLTSG